MDDVYFSQSSDASYPTSVGLRLSGRAEKASNQQKQNDLPNTFTSCILYVSAGLDLCKEIDSLIFTSVYADMAYRKLHPFLGGQK